MRVIIISLFLIGCGSLTKVSGPREVKECKPGYVLTKGKCAKRMSIKSRSTIWVH